MSHPDIRQLSQQYFRRFAFLPPRISAPCSPATRLMLVIPCYNEPDLLTTLNSLAQADSPRHPVEVIVVINAGTQAPPEVHRQNQETRRSLERWQEVGPPDFLRCHLLYVNDLPAKHAGVGLARKIGMDEALSRFATIDHDGLIMNLDADCTVASSYFSALEGASLSPTLASCIVSFEHDLDSIEDSDLRSGIIYYELFLRYYVNSLRYAGFPQAFHTVGSCMGTRASVYARSGGMNRRRAGEDFYFLHKIAPLGTPAVVRNTTVYPSARLSDRVPFGTGRAQIEWLAHSNRHRYLYHPQIFEELSQLMEAIPGGYRTSADGEAMVRQLPVAVGEFLKEQDFPKMWDDLRASTRTWEAFQKRFFQWMDGFLVLKYVHFARDHCYPSVPAEKACFTLLRKLRILKAEKAPTANDLLQRLRDMDWHDY